MSARTCRWSDGKADRKIVPPRLRIPYWKGLGAESEEKHEPASDIDTGVVDSLKALDLKRPIREADICSAPAHVRFGPIADMNSANLRPKMPCHFLDGVTENLPMQQGLLVRSALLPASTRKSDPQPTEQVES